MSLGIVDLLPIPPLDGGRFIDRGFQKLTKRQVGYNKAMNIMTMTGMALFAGSSYSLLNQRYSAVLSLGIGRATELSLGIGRTAEFEVRISGPNKEAKRIRDYAGPLFLIIAETVISRC